MTGVQTCALPICALERLLGDVRSSLGTEIANELIDEFDLELLYNLSPTESEGSGD